MRQHAAAACGGAGADGPAARRGAAPRAARGAARRLHRGRRVEGGRAPAAGHAGCCGTPLLDSSAGAGGQLARALLSLRPSPCPQIPLLDKAALRLLHDAQFEGLRGEMQQYRQANAWVEQSALFRCGPVLTSARPLRRPMPGLCGRDGRGSQASAGMTCKLPQLLTKGLSNGQSLRSVPRFTLSSWLSLPPPPPTTLPNLPQRADRAAGAGGQGVVGLARGRARPAARGAGEVGAAGARRRPACRRASALLRHRAAHSKPQQHVSCMVGPASS